MPQLRIIQTVTEFGRSLSAGALDPVGLTPLQELALVMSGMAEFVGNPDAVRMPDDGVVPITSVMLANPAAYGLAYASGRTYECNGGRYHWDSVNGRMVGLNGSQAAAFSGTGVRTSGPATRTAIGGAADQTDAEVMRLAVPAGLLSDYSFLRVFLSGLKRNAVASNVAVSFNVGVGPRGVSYGSSTKLFAADDSTSLAAVGTAGQSRSMYHQYGIVGLGPLVQECFNAKIPSATVGPSANAVQALALDWAAGFDIVVGGRFAAAAPAGDNFTITCISLGVF